MRRVLLTWSEFTSTDGNSDRMIDAHITGSGWTLDKGTKLVHVSRNLKKPDYPDYHIYDVDVDGDEVED